MSSIVEKYLRGEDVPEDTLDKFVETGEGLEDEEATEQVKDWRDEDVEVTAEDISKNLCGVDISGDPKAAVVIKVVEFLEDGTEKTISTHVCLNSYLESVVIGNGFMTMTVNFQTERNTWLDKTKEIYEVYSQHGGPEKYRFMMVAASMSSDFPFVLSADSLILCAFSNDMASNRPCVASFIFPDECAALIRTEIDFASIEATLYREGENGQASESMLEDALKEIEDNRIVEDLEQAADYNMDELLDDQPVVRDSSMERILAHKDSDRL